ncbi:DUF427-domain-containing protein [Jaminaea rosea]|uniref:DUF427-domain-containing protein n=1 Tax=Jaminaea rosea TaxID=1569628 RepID=A0A316UU32_9BASI|nr:DUF427-domain-containing protein [Jaminaea rosea]PWN28504.1 DUF427-domain-containing protein [Jaminaea rosea]
MSKTVRPVESVWNYPRPPRLEPTSSRLRVIWESKDGGEKRTVAETTKGYRVLETSHPPTYYFPPSSIDMSLLRPSTARRTMCEWKGQATYHDLVLPSDNSTIAARGRAWSYPEPVPEFKSIKDYLCFYASPQSKVGTWRCYVDDDEVTAQEGDFYGSWVTPEITGGERGFKGGPGTMGW